MPHDDTVDYDWDVTLLFSAARVYDVSNNILASIPTCRTKSFD